MLALVAAALAQDTIDIGVLKESELRVVQKQLYSKEGRLEYGVGLGAVMDGFTVAPKLAPKVVYHLSDRLGIGGELGGGYGLESGLTTLLESPTYGVAVEANRYIASAEVHLEYTPIYAKMNFFKKSIVHYDIYGVAGAGVMIESSLIPPPWQITVAPTIPLGIGSRFFVSKNAFVRFEVRDELAIEHFVQSGTSGLIQKPTVTLGIAAMAAKK